MSTRADDSDLSYTVSSDPAVDVAEYRDDSEAAEVPLGARGADNLPTSVNANQEDAYTANSEATGLVSKAEVDDLLAATGKEERSKTGTRGVKADAFKQEAALDAMDFDERT